jgi:hypothetical protein
MQQPFLTTKKGSPTSAIRTNLDAFVINSINRFGTERDKSSRLLLTRDVTVNSRKGRRSQVPIVVLPDIGRNQTSVVRLARFGQWPTGFTWYFRRGSTVQTQSSTCRNSVGTRLSSPPGSSPCLIW